MTSSPTPSKHGRLLISFLLLALIPSSSSTTFGRKKEARLHFYIRSIFGGPDSTNIIAGSPNNGNGTSVWGTTRVIGHELRSGPEPTSPLIGRSQGSITQASRFGVANLVLTNYVLKDRPYSVSELAIFERSALAENVSTASTMTGGQLTASGRNVTMASIVGGTGKYMGARGQIALRVYSLINTTESQILTLMVDAHFKYYQTKH